MHQPIKFLELAHFWTSNWDEIINDLERFIKDGVYIGGEHLENFERAFAKWTNARFAHGVGNGLDAIKIALTAMEIGNGDEVIVPSNTFIATWLAASEANCTIKSVEPNWSTHVLDVESIRAAITSSTKCIIYVTLYGNSDNLEIISQICEQKNIKLIIDAAQSHGTKIHGRGLGEFGDAVCYSFYPGKTLGGIGDGGAITTNSTSISNAARLLRNYGSKTKYHHEIKGFNSRLDPIQAIFLFRKMSEIINEISVRKKQMLRYQSEINYEFATMVQSHDFIDVSWHLAVGVFQQRDELQEYLRQSNIETIIHYPIPAHLQPAYRGTSISSSNSQTEVYSRKLLSLPLGSHLNNSDIDYIIEKVKQFYKS